MQVYYECFHSILKYGLIFWGNSPKAERFISLTKAHYSFELCAKNGKILSCTLQAFFLQLKVLLTLPALFILETAIMVRESQRCTLEIGKFMNMIQDKPKSFMYLKQKVSIKNWNKAYRCQNTCKAIPYHSKHPAFKIALKNYLLERVYSMDEFLNPE